MSVVLLVTILATANPDPATFDPDSIGGLPLATVARYFAEFDSLCARDAGALWGVSYAGPMLIVDPMTRRVAANQADSTGALGPRNGVFVGTLPPDLPIANTAVDWLGARWTMLMAQSLSPNLRPRSRLMGHEAFHRIQPQLGLEAAGETATVNLMDWLIAEHGYTPTDAYCLVSTCPDFRINVYQMCKLGKLSFVAGAELPSKYCRV